MDPEVFTIKLCFQFTREETLDNSELIGYFCSVVLSGFEELGVSMQRALRKNGFDMEEMEFEMKPGIEAAYDEWVEERECPKGPKLAYAMLCIVILLMAKRLDGKNYQAWMNGRSRALSARFILGPDGDETIHDLFPLSDRCLMVYESVCTLFSVRHLIMDVLFDSQKREGDVKNMAEFCLTMLQWTEASHLNVIIEQIVMKYPDVLLCPEVRCELLNLQLALDYLQKLGEHAPYFQLVTNPQEQRPTEKKNFLITTTAAWKLRSIAEKKDEKPPYAGFAIEWNDSRILMICERINALKTVSTRAQETMANAVYRKRKIVPSKAMSHLIKPIKTFSPEIDEVSDEDVVLSQSESENEDE